MNIFINNRKVKVFYKNNTITIVMSDSINNEDKPIKPPLPSEEEISIPLVMNISEINCLIEDSSDINVQAYNIPNDNNSEINYFSSDNSIASIDNSGNIYVHSVGECYIYAQNSNKAKTYCKLIIKENTPTQNIEILNNNLVFNYNKPQSIDFNITPINSTDSIIFSSSNDQVATVDENGNVNPIANGNCYISITSGSVSATVSVTVNFIETLDVESQILQLNSLSHRFSGRQETDLYSTNKNLIDYVTKNIYTDVINGIGCLGKDGWMGRGIKLNKGNYVKDSADNIVYGYFDFGNQLNDIDLYSDYTLNINYRQLEKTRDMTSGNGGKVLFHLSNAGNNWCSLRIEVNTIYFSFGGVDGSANNVYSTVIPNYDYTTENNDCYLTISLKKQNSLTSDGFRVYDAFINYNGNIVEINNMINKDTIHETCPVNYFGISRSPFDGASNAYLHSEIMLYDMNIFTSALTQTEVQSLHDTEYSYIESVLKATDFTVYPNSINVKKGDIFKININVLPNTSDSKKFLFTSSNDNIAKIDENGNIYGILEGNCIITLKLIRENIIKTIPVQVSNLDLMTPFVKTINTDESVTTKLFNQNYQPLYASNLERPTTMWAKKGLYNNNQYVVFESDTLPYCFNFPLENASTTDHVSLDGFTTIKNSQLSSFEGKAIVAYSKYNLNYMFIKVPVSELSDTTPNAFQTYLTENNFNITFKLLTNDEYTFKTIIDGNKDISIIYDDNTKIDNYIQFKIKVNGFISEYDIKAGRNLFLANYEYNDFSSKLPRKEWYCWYDKEELYIKIKMPESELATNDLSGIREYLNQNNLIIYSNIHDKTIDMTRLTLNQNNIKTNMANAIKLKSYFEPSNASHNSEMDWVSSDENIAMVVDGLVVPKSPGECVITAYSRNSKISDSCNVTIFPCSKINVVETMKKNTSLKEGDIYTTNGYYYDDDGGAASYEIVSYNDWFASLPDDIKLVEYKDRVFEKNPVDGYGNHVLDNGLVAKLIIENDTTYAEQWGANEFLDNNAKQIQAMFIYNRYNRTIKFKKDSVYLICNDTFNKKGYEWNEYSSLTCCLNTKYLNIGNCNNMVIDFNNSTLKINDVAFDGQGYIGISGNVNNLEIKNMIFDGNAFNITETTMTVPTYHAIVIRGNGRRQTGNYETMAEEIGLVLDNTQNEATFNNIRIHDNVFKNLGTAVSLAQSTGADNGGDAILMMQMDHCDNIYITNNTVTNWGRWFVAIDLPASGKLYTNININDNTCIQDENNSFVTSNGDRRFRGMGWIDFETTAYFKDLHVEGNRVYGLAYFAFNGGGQVNENIYIRNNYIERATNRSYLRGALDLGWNFYSVRTKNITFEGNTFINVSPSKLGVSFLGNNVFRNNNCGGKSMTLLSLDGNLLFENNTDFGIGAAINSGGKCGLDYFEVTNSDWGIESVYQDRYLIFRNNTNLSFTDGNNKTIYLHDTSGNNKYNDLHFVFENNSIKELKISNFDNVDFDIDLETNTFNNSGSSWIKNLTRPDSYKEPYLCLYAKSGQVIVENTGLQTFNPNSTVPTVYYYYYDNLGLDQTTWEVTCKKSFRTLYDLGYRQIVCEEEGYLPNVGDDALLSFNYLKGKSVNLGSIVICNSTRKVYMVIVAGTLGTEEPSTNLTNFKSGSATLKYLCNCAKLKAIIPE